MLAHLCTLLAPQGPSGATMRCARPVLRMVHSWMQSFQQLRETWGYSSWGLLRPKKGKKSMETKGIPYPSCLRGSWLRAIGLQADARLQAVCMLLCREPQRAEITPRQSLAERLAGHQAESLVFVTRMRSSTFWGVLLVVGKDFFEPADPLWGFWYKRATCCQLSLAACMLPVPSATLWRPTPNVALQSLGHLFVCRCKRNSSTWQPSCCCAPGEVVTVGGPALQHHRRHTGVWVGWGELYSFLRDPFLIGMYLPKVLSWDGLLAWWLVHLKSHSTQTWMAALVHHYLGSLL